jgi:hypothetical protein
MKPEEEAKIAELIKLVGMVLQAKVYLFCKKGIQKLRKIIYYVKHI